MRVRFSAIHSILLCLVGIMTFVTPPVAAQTPAVPYEQRVYLANRAFGEKKYEEAIRLYDALLHDCPGWESTDVLLFNRAQCQFALKRPEEGLGSLEQLRAECPNSLLAPDGLVLLYKGYTELGQADRAAGIWTALVARWPNSPQVGQLVEGRCREIAKRHPEQALEMLTLIDPLNISAPRLIQVIFRPLIEAGRVKEALAVRDALLTQLAASGAPAARAKVVSTAFLESLTPKALERMAEACAADLKAGKRESARQWLDALNAIAPESPQAVAAWQQYRQKTATSGETTPPAMPPVTMIPGDGLNLELVEQSAPDSLIVKVNPPVHNWFAGTVTNLPTDREVTISLSLDGNGADGNTADVKKWQGLRPVMTYGDPAKYETYEWFRKDAEGRWVSGDPFKQGEAIFAGTGKVPEQTAIPAAVAEQFLSADGTYWQPWREIENTEAVQSLNIFRMTERFALPTATVAMRVPYTYTYLQQYIERLKAANIPGVFVDEIGTTPGGRKLQVIRIDDVNMVTPFVMKMKRVTLDMPEEMTYRIDDAQGVTDKPRVLLLSAQEHATEPASSWMVIGALRALLAADQTTESLRKSTTWLFIVVFDPDGNANSIFDRLTNEFMPHHDVVIDNTPVEVIAYIRYLRAFVNSGRPLDCVTSIHNVECNENSNVSLPFAIGREVTITNAMASSWFARLAEQNISIDKPEPAQIGRVDNRLYGLANNSYYSIPLAFEMNDRDPKHRLHLADLQGVGQSYPTVLVNLLETPAGRERTTATRTFLDDRRQKMTELWKTRPWAEDSPTIFELLAWGY